MKALRWAASLAVGLAIATGSGTARAADPPAAAPGPVTSPAQPTPVASPAPSAPVPQAAPAPQPAPAPAPAQAAPVQAAPASPSDPLPQSAAAPYGLGVEGVTVQTGPGTQYQLSARQWRDLVQNDPELARLNRRARAFVPGIVLTSVGGTWLVISSAMAIDQIRAETATGAVFQWVLPAALTLSGAVMTVVGVRARRELDIARNRLFVAPHASRGSAGVTVMGRF